MRQKINAALLWVKSLFQRGSSGTAPTKKPVIEKPRPNQDENTTGKPLLWIPFAHQIKGGMGYKGTYAGGYPRGAIVHYTAGRFAGGLKKAIDTMAGGKENGFTFLVISEDGEVVQGFPLDKWGWHAGQSSHPKLSGSVSDELIGIEICNAGLLTKRGNKYVAWYGLEIPEPNVRSIDKRDKNIAAGHYHKYTDAQESALIHLLLWLKKNNPDRFDLNLVLGHDEVTMNPNGTSSRKQDPGGSLSMNMETFRQRLIQLWNEENK